MSKKAIVRYTTRHSLKRKMAKKGCPADIPGRIWYCITFITVLASVGTTIVMVSSWVQYSSANAIYTPAAAINWVSIDGGCTIESLSDTTVERACSGGNMMRTCSETTLYKHNVVAGGASYTGPAHPTDFSNGTNTSCWHTDDADAEAAWTAAGYHCGSPKCLIYDDPEPEVAWLHPGSSPIGVTVVLVVVLLLCATSCALPRLTAKLCPVRRAASLTQRHTRTALTPLLPLQGKLGSIGADYESDSSDD